MEGGSIGSNIEMKAMNLILVMKLNMKSPPSNQILISLSSLEAKAQFAAGYCGFTENPVFSPRSGFTVLSHHVRIGQCVREVYV